MNRQKRSKLGWILVTLALLALTATVAAAAERVVTKEHGTLTAVEKDGKIVISDKVYLSSPGIRVYDFMGRRAKLDELELPVSVYIEFVYTSAGTEVRLLKVTPQ